MAAAGREISSLDNDDDSSRKEKSESDILRLTANYALHLRTVQTFAQIQKVIFFKNSTTINFHLKPTTASHVTQSPPPPP